MLSCFHFFSSKQDLCKIFKVVEQEFSIKYCLIEANQEGGKEEVPQMEFATIEEIADDFTATHSIAPRCMIAPKTEVIELYWRRMQRDGTARYCMNLLEYTNGVQLKGMEKHEDLTCEFYVYINREHETEFSAALFKSMIREIRRNCVRVKNTAPTYIGKELYKDRENRVFCGERCSAFTVTAANEAKEWYRCPKVRKFADGSFREKLSFLQRVFEGKEIKDYSEERKNFSEDFQIYRVAEGAVWRIKDLNLLKEVFALFDDEVKVPSSPGTSTAMEYLCEASVYVASAQKPDGIRMLLEQMHFIPEKGYHCGCEGIVKILLNGSNFQKCKTSLANADRDTKALVKKILEGLTDKKMAGKRNELVDMLKRDLEKK